MLSQHCDTIVHNIITNIIEILSTYCTLFTDSACYHIPNNILPLFW